MTVADPTSPTYNRWLARDFIEFEDDVVFDLVIVGSGYGAAMAAATFAGCAGPDGKWLRIALLERGREVLPGGFPSTLDELPGHVRLSRAGQTPIGRRDALFDVRLAGDVSALVANGLGGGSLINAGVMVEPRWGSFDSRLPAGVEADLHEQWISKAKRLLGAEVPSGNGAWLPNTITRHAHVQSGNPLPKTLALQTLASAAPVNQVPNAMAMRDEPAAITVRLSAQDNAKQTVELTPCSLCGDCLTGCNVGAKASLDTNLLVDAQRRGLEIYTSASVLHLQRDTDCWSVAVVHTDPRVQSRRLKPVQVRAHKVVLAAGSLGSTEILLRSQRSDTSGGLRFSPRLGEQFSLNGDNTAFIRFPEGVNVNALADESLPLTGPEGVSPRRVGPEITHIVEWPSDSKGPGFLLQEFSVPAPLRGIFQDIVTTRSWFDRLAAGDFKNHAAAKPNETDPLAIDPEAMQRELMVGLIGHDSASGTLKLPQDSPGEGSVRVTWKGVGQDPAMADAFQKLEQRVKARLGEHARLTPNPMWRLVPEALTGVVGSAGGGALTVHPLGGCAMGDSALNGVVNQWGGVFNTGPAQADNWHGSLLVLDGAMVPASLGANPALTIAALSMRAASHWRTQWKWKQTPFADSDEKPKQRPRARSLETCLPKSQPIKTEVRIMERLRGEVPKLRGPDGPERRVVELTFGFRPQSVEALVKPLKKTLTLDPSLRSNLFSINTLRIYKASDWERESLDVKDDDKRKQYAEVVAQLEGQMGLLVREPNLAPGRVLRAGLAYFRNRGLRDFARASNFQWTSFLEKICVGARIASQAGEVRSFLYRMQVSDVKAAGSVADQRFWKTALHNAKIEGDKRFTYAWGENPWNQLLYLNLGTLGRGLMPMRWWPWQKAPQLKLDARFLVSTGIPLLRITKQANQVKALADLAQLGMHWTRLFIKLQVWHFRAPDPSPEGPPQRLPGAVKGLPAPEVTELELEPMAAKGAGAPPRAVVRLTRYRSQSCSCGGDEKKPPLVFIHGYSASGTSYAHDAIPRCAALHFWEAGRDVWVLDLRTSAGMPTAKLAWAFEDAAWADIPVAINHIAEKVGQERRLDKDSQVDVFAHCIGGVMLSLALTRGPGAAHRAPGMPTRYKAELARLPGQIRKLVLSQKGFLVEYADANVLRGYLINYFKGNLAGGYSFRPPLEPRLRDTLFDSFLNMLPYPPSEWPRENPWFARVPWGATRRRMDALYERTFNIKRMPRRVLERIDDFFGPLSLDTVAQVIHFAREGEVTDRNGRHLSPYLLNHWPRQGTLLLNSKDNGMVNPHNSLSMQKALAGDGVPHIKRVLLDGGHQDILIGNYAEKTWQIVEDFLNES